LLVSVFSLSPHAGLLSCGCLLRVLFSVCFSDPPLVVLFFWPFGSFLGRLASRSFFFCLTSKFCFGNCPDLNTRIRCLSSAGSLLDSLFDWTVAGRSEGDVCADPLPPPVPPQCGLVPLLLGECQRQAAPAPGNFFPRPNPRLEVRSFSLIFRRPPVKPGPVSFGWVLESLRGPRRFCFSLRFPAPDTLSLGLFESRSCGVFADPHACIHFSFVPRWFSMVPFWQRLHQGSVDSYFLFCFRFFNPFGESFTSWISYGFHVRDTPVRSVVGPPFRRLLYFSDPLFFFPPGFNHFEVFSFLTRAMLVTPLSPAR